MRWWNRFTKSDLFVILTFTTLFASIIISWFGLIVGGIFQRTGQIMEIMGRIGVGVAFIGISTLFILYPRSFTKC